MFGGAPITPLTPNSGTVTRRYVEEEFFNDFFSVSQAGQVKTVVSDNPLRFE